jgi:hypothetical protein
VQLFDLADSGNTGRVSKTTFRTALETMFADGMSLGKMTREDMEVCACAYVYARLCACSACVCVYV